MSPAGGGVVEPVAGPSGAAEGRIAGLGAIVVNRDAGEELLKCVASLRRAGIGEIVVVDNASRDGSLARLADSDRQCVLVPTGRNLGYGRAVNRGIARSTSEYLLVCNPDLVVDVATPARLVASLDREPDLAIVGPKIVDLAGTVYPSARAFPHFADAVGHALIGVISTDNRWTKRYRLEAELATSGADSRLVDWVSGACMCVRRLAFSSVGGFDEAYFMYVEDLDLCWRLRRAGWQIRYLPEVAVTHLQGLSTSRHPVRMLASHHRSTWRFVRRSTTGRARAGLPVIGAGLIVRFSIAAGRALIGSFRAERKRATRPVE